MNKGNGITVHMKMALIAPAADTGAQTNLTSDEAKTIAKEVFYWGMHPVAIYHLRYNFSQNELNPRAWEQLPAAILKHY